MESEKDKVFSPGPKGPTVLKQMNLKKQLKLHLDQSGITASQLAKKAGVPKQSLSGWLSGSNPRDVRQVKKVADVFNVTVDHLMFGTGLSEENEKIVGLGEIFGDAWVGGLFEIRLRRVKR